MKNKGFTLIELLAVIVILALILAVGVPTVTNAITKSKRETFRAAVLTAMRAAENQIHVLDNPSGTYCIGITATATTGLTGCTGLDAAHLLLISGYDSKSHFNSGHVVYNSATGGATVYAVSSKNTNNSFAGATRDNVTSCVPGSCSNGSLQ